MSDTMNEAGSGVVGNNDVDAVEIEPADELASLVAGFRAQLGWRARSGVHAVPGGVSRLRSPDAEIEPVSPFNAADDRESICSGLSLQRVREDLGDCQRCKLSARRNKLVFGVGDPNASILFIGEAPGAEEDRRGEPFVGSAGTLLDKMIAAMGWSRKTVYIANVLKCRPPGNRDPEADEIAACEPFLARQIDAIGPRVIVTLGKPAAHLLLSSRAPMSALRGRFHSYRGIQVMPTFHPAYLLRSPSRRGETWSDLKQVIALLEALGVRGPSAPHR